jgi:hypothetical protein
MPSPKVPEPPSPREAAQAAVSAAQAGDIYQIANAPIQGYADLYTQAMLGPARMQLQQSLANQAALSGAMAQQAVQSQTDPMAYQIRQMNLKAASSRLGQLYSMDPTAFSYKAPAAFATPTAAALPSLAQLSAHGGWPIAQALSSVGLKGNTPYLIGPPNANLAPTGARGPSAQLPSYLGVG